MSSGSSGQLVEHFQRLIDSHATSGSSDGELLQLFIAQRDETAFQTLVRRHGPMVLGVCRRVLSDPHRADDAFQATFLTLARNAGSVRRQESVGSWLHGVALRLALRVREKMNQQRLRETPLEDVPSRAPASTEVNGLIDEELRRLPEKYRQPVVLHYFQGLTTEAVAQVLSWPVGTVRTRLVKARDLLRDRLRQRGVELTATALAAVLTPEALTAGVSAPLLTATSSAATALLAGQAPASALVATLVEEGAKEVLRRKIARIAGLLIAASLLVGGTGFALSQLASEPTQATEPERRPQPQAPVAEAPLPPELALVPPEAVGFLSLQVASLVKTPLGNEVEQRLKKANLTPAQVLQLDDDLETRVGIKLSDVERYTFLLVRIGPDDTLPLHLFTTLKPYDREKLLRLLGPKVAEANHNGKSYFMPSEGEAHAMHFAGERTFAVGQLAAVREWLGSPERTQARGSLDGALRLARKHLVTVGMNAPSLRSLLNDEAGSNKELQPLVRARTASATATLTDSQLEIDLILSYVDGASRDQAITDLRTSRRAIQARLAEQIANYSRSEGHEQTVSLLSKALATAADAPVRPDGLRLHVPCYIKADAAMLAAAAIEFLRGKDSPKMKALHARDANSLRQLAIAMHLYHDTAGAFPSAAIRDKDGKPLLSWRVALLPYLEQDALYKEFKLDEPWDSEHNKKLLDRMPRLYRSQRGKNRDGHTFYQVWTGKSALFEKPEVPSLTEITKFDGASNTLLIVEGGEEVPWTKPDNLVYAADKPLPKLGGASQDGFLAAFADAHVQFIPAATEEKILRALITWNGREIVNLP